LNEEGNWLRESNNNNDENKEQEQLLGLSFWGIIKHHPQWFVCGFLHMNLHRRGCSGDWVISNAAQILSVYCTICHLSANWYFLEKPKGAADASILMFSYPNLYCSTGKLSIQHFNVYIFFSIWVIVWLYNCSYFLKYFLFKNILIYFKKIIFNIITSKISNNKKKY